MENNKKTISIRTILITVFMVVTIISISLISFIVFRNWFITSQETTQRIAQDLNSEIFHQIESFLEIPHQINSTNRDLIEYGVVDIEQEIEREKFFVSVLNSNIDDIYSFSFGTENGEYYGARRNTEGAIEIMRNNAETGGVSWYYAVNEDLTAGERTVVAGKFDPRTRDWYKAAINSGEFVFSPIYKHFIMEDLTVSAAIPIYQNDGSLKGVLGTHIILGNINKYLAEIVSDKNGYAVIVEKDGGALIANSFNQINFLIDAEGNFNRIYPSDLTDLVTENGFEYYRSTGNTQFVLPINQNNYYFNVTEYQKYGLEWIIISAIPESLLLNDFNRNLQLTIIMVVLSLIISLLIYYLLMNKLFHRIKDLIKNAEAFTKGDLSQRANIGRVDEIGKISIAFNQMAETVSSLVNHLDEAVNKRTVELEEAKLDLEESKNQLRFILDTAVEGIYGIDLNGDCTFCNKSAVKLFGFQDQKEILGKNMHELVHHSYPNGELYPIEKCTMLHEIVEGENSLGKEDVLWRKNGSSFIVEYYAFPQYRENKLIGNLITFMDITERKLSEEKIKFISCHDSLTGLYNRRCFEETMRAKDKKHNLPISIIFADVNALKLTNDIFGHKAGDRLINQAAKILNSACRTTDIIGRIGGDEFIILLPHTSKEETKKIINRINEQMSKDITDMIKCSLAMGCDTKTSEGENLEKIMENAENNMYKEKTLNRQMVNEKMLGSLVETLYLKDPQQESHAATVTEISEQLGLALHFNELELHNLKKAARFHDIGKIAFPEKILTQWYSLRETEKNELHQHTAVGYRLMNFFDNSQDLLDGIYYHHEHWDGSGYPKGLIKEAIPLFARIIAVANHYDWLMKVNNNKSAKDIQIKLQECAGNTLDPELVTILIKNLNSQ